MLDLGDPSFRDDVNIERLQGSGHQVSHLQVQRRHDMVTALDDSCVDAAVSQGFGRFDTDESPADDQRRFCGFCQVHNLLRIIDRAQCVHPRGIQALNRGTRGPRSGRKHQLVVAFGEDTPVRTAYLHGFRIRVHADDLVVYPHIQVQFRFQALGCVQQQAFPRGNLLTDIKRQSTVRKRGVRPFFKHHNFG